MRSAISSQQSYQNDCIRVLRRDDRSYALSFGSLFLLFLGRCSFHVLRLLLFLSLFRFVLRVLVCRGTVPVAETGRQLLALLLFVGLSSSLEILLVCALLGERSLSEKLHYVRFVELLFLKKFLCYLKEQHTIQMET